MAWSPPISRAWAVPRCRGGGAHKTTLVTRSGAQQNLVFPFLSDLPLSGADDDFGPIRVVNPHLHRRAGAIHFVWRVTAMFS